jgi:hypothetical protein
MNLIMKGIEQTASILAVLLTGAFFLAPRSAFS